MADTQAVILNYRQEAEYYFDEGCFINELSNSAADPQVSVAQARVAPGETTRWHALDGITERYVILAGSGLVEIGDDITETVSGGDVVIIPPGVRQRIANTAEGDLIFLAICSPRFTASAYRDLDDKPATQ